MDHELHEHYEVAAGPVELTVVIGDGQRGVTLVFLDTQELTARPGSGGHYLVGSGPDLAGHSLSVESTVADVRAETNRTSITYRLTGGAETKEFRQTAPAGRAGGQVDYVATFDLRA